MKKFLYTLVFSLLLLGAGAGSSRAQEKIPIDQSDYQNQQVDMADQFRADGKIWVVLVVAGLIFVGFIGYTVSIDRRLGRLEKELPSAKTDQLA